MTDDLPSPNGDVELDELLRLTGDRPCDLGNIEVYYRLALYYVARGDRDMALAMFDTVDEASPGYRDAWKQADAIRAGNMPSGSAPALVPSLEPEPPPPIALELDLDLPGDAPPPRAVGSSPSSPVPVPVPVDATIVEALRTIEAVLAALEQIHSRRAIHGFLSPTSFVRMPSGTMTLLDADSGLRMPGGPYQAPEQLAREASDARCDLFAVAVILYEMLSGRLPFDGEDRSATPPPLAELVPSVPPALDELVMRALAVRKEDRWSSAFVMRARLQKVIAALS